MTATPRRSIDTLRKCVQLRIARAAPRGFCAGVGYETGWDLVFGAYAHLAGRRADLSEPSGTGG